MCEILDIITKYVEMFVCCICCKIATTHSDSSWKIIGLCLHRSADKDAVVAPNFVVDQALSKCCAILLLQQQQY